MSRNFIRSLVTVCLVSAAWSLALAQDNPVEVTLEGYLVNTITKEDGTTEEEFVAASEARPGQVVEYRVIVTNVSNETLPASNALITGPIPATTAYIADSAELASVLLSSSANSDSSFSVTCRSTTSSTDSTTTSTVTCFSDEDGQAVNSGIGIEELTLSQIAMLEFSSDNGATFAEKPMIEKENADGDMELVEALPEEYTAARWAILVPLEPQQTLTFTYRVTVK
jgi:uncharacterized repeat protein (TIGR01451 family)